ncbi:hypothetical protein T484DRAFT_1758233 [Baffinella frigidus]|nr:hypothetical protein T484DRAFT_1758233 [Cryptophyta sp. CCMP2293]
MAAKSLELVGPKIEMAINQLRTSQNNITQSATGAAIHVNDAQELSIPVQVGYTERTHTGSELIPASDQVLFSVGFLLILDDIIIQLTDLTELANAYSRRNSEANTDVDTLKTTKLRLEFLSLAQEHMMCRKAISDTDTSDSSFSANGPKMSKFREQFLRKSIDDMVAEKKKNGQATMGQDITKKTFQTTLDQLTKSTNCLKFSPWYQDAKSGGPLDAHRWGIMTKTITSVEEIVKDMEEIVKDTGQVSFTPTEAYTPDKKMETTFAVYLLSFFYCADDVHEFNYTVQTSALLVTTTAITGKGADGDNKMKEYFYDFIEALFDATQAQALKQELDKKADMFKRTPLPYYTIKVPYAEIADQLAWPTEVRLKARELFTQKAVRVPKHAPKDATQMEDLKPVIEVNPTHNPLKPVHQTVDKVLRERDPVQPASKRETTTPRPPSGRVHGLGSMLPPASPMPTPPTETPGRKLTPMPVVPTLIQESHLRVPLKAFPPHQV